MRIALIVVFKLANTFILKIGKLVQNEILKLFVVVNNTNTTISELEKQIKKELLSYCLKRILTLSSII